MDMTLEKKYSKPTTGPSKIIGISRKKEQVCIWSLIRDDKLLCTSNFIHLHINSFGSLLLAVMHRKFSPSANKPDKIAIDTLFEYFKENVNPFDFFNEKVTNFVTAEFIDPNSQKIS